MMIENLTSPGVDPVDGDLVRITHGNGAIEIKQYFTPAPPSPPEPPTLPPLTRRQLRLALLSIGVTADHVETHIADITDPVDRAAALIEWEDATHYKRDHPLVADVAAAMQLPPEQVDALWVWAAGI
ncbi:hypothetical protein [Agrobacterium sp. MS2]|uniref:hypothetical protein n=1 Tax=Agrobacterium sp. MS2 TaxID=1345498 RepID=UPI000DB8F6F8|nr:hypothetical protein [Agrobacterium sp. MS2]PZP72864.1 MAG: hypothetical protein DI604_13160 [Delftia acidovorans]RAL95613.1 hypothetical protein DOU54_20870 [Agrobacterium sp. MS2]